MKNIIFDLGGVLINWNSDIVYKKHFNNDQEKIKNFYEETQIRAANKKMDRGKPFQVALDELAEKFPHHHEPIHFWKSKWLDMIGGPIEDSVKILKSLYNQRYPLYALTNWSREKFFEHIMGQPQYEFLDLFRDIVVSGVEKEIKPEPRIYEILIKRNELNPKECVYIDDVYENIIPAQKLGMSTIQFRFPEQLADDLTKILHSK